MNRPAQVGLIGCGMISSRYVENARLFDSFEIIACADVDLTRSANLARAYALRAVSVEELLADCSVDVVLNLTPPDAHASLTRRALEAGKHVYTEKPLARNVEEGIELLGLADRCGLRLGCAPDTFCSGPYVEARRLIDAGAIGQPLAVEGAMLVAGAETWHPRPSGFYSNGVGPLLDMGPYYLTVIVALLGPVRAVSGFAFTRGTERTAAVGPNAGERFAVLTPTHVAASMALENDLTASIVTSFDSGDNYVHELVVHGTDGSLALPDPNAFLGPLRIRTDDGDWRDVPFDSRSGDDERGIGLDDMIRSLQVQRPHRASGELGLHVLEVAHAILEASDTRSVREIRSHPAQPKPLASHPGRCRFESG